MIILQLRFEIGSVEVDPLTKNRNHVFFGDMLVATIEIGDASLSKSLPPSKPSLKAKRDDK
jgi:hypothetical protein